MALVPTSASAADLDCGRPDLELALQQRPAGAAPLHRRRAALSAALADPAARSTPPARPRPPEPPRAAASRTDRRRGPRPARSGSSGRSPPSAPPPVGPRGPPGRGPGPSRPPAPHVRAPSAACVASQSGSGSAGTSGTGLVAVGSRSGVGSMGSPSPSGGSCVGSSPSSGAVRFAAAGEGPTCFPQTSQIQPVTGASQTGQGRTRLGLSSGEGQASSGRTGPRSAARVSSCPSSRFRSRTSSWPSCCPPMGPTRRPPGASCSTSVSGIRSGAAVSTMASNGAASGQPAKPSPTRRWSRGPANGWRCSAAARARPSRTSMLYTSAPSRCRTAAW